jgi:glycosyltransferase involved in cell wall biosynthesis
VEQEELQVRKLFAMTPKTSVLFITPQTPPLGGVAMQTERFLDTDEITRRFTVSVLRSNPRREHENPGGRKTVSAGIALWTLGFLFRAFAIGLKKRPEVVYVATCNDLSFIRNMAGALLAALPRRGSIVLHFHAWRGGICVSEASGPLFGKLLHSMASWLLRRAWGVIHLTKAIDDSFRSNGLRGADWIVPNCVEIGPTPDLSVKDPCSILFIGRLSREKGFFDLLDALESQRLDRYDWKLHVLGCPTTAAASEIEHRLANHGQSARIRRYGAVAGEVKAALLKKCSLFVLPSYGEVFPVSMIEAMAAGQAVIATPVGETCEIPAPDGWVSVQPGDTSGLIDAIEQILEDSYLRMELGRRNRRKAEEEYDVRIHVERLEEVFAGAAMHRASGGKCASFRDRSQCMR